MKVKEEKIWTIEINLNDDFAYSCSYHVDDLKSTSSRNIRAACEKTKNDPWVLIGLATSHSEALDKCEMIRLKLCKMHNRKPYGI